MKTNGLIYLISSEERNFLVKVAFCVFFSKFYLGLSGQFFKRAKKHVDGIFSIFKPNPKTHEKASHGHCKQ